MEIPRSGENKKTLATDIPGGMSDDDLPRFVSLDLRSTG